MGNNASATCASLGPTRKTELLRILLEVIQRDLVPVATDAVEKGDAYSAVGVLRKSDLSLVGCGRDATKTRDPTSTAELNAIQGLFALKSDTRPEPKDCVFLCMHEPTDMALYQIAQCGFDNFVFLFTREEAKEFGIEGSTVQMKDIFKGVTADEGYHTENCCWTAVGLGELIEKSNKKETHKETVEAIRGSYQAIASKDTSAAVGPETPVRTAENA